MRTRITSSLALMALAALPTADAQGFGNEWVSFTEDASRLVVAEPVSSPTHEVDFAWGDLNLDGWIDLVVVRKEPFSTPGKRTNVLLLNKAGVLTDSTALFASASDVPEDQGFLTPTNDRDAAIADLDLDGWPDVITATTISVGDPKHVGHPRAYMNLGQDGSGDWLGLRYEEARIPQLYTIGAGLPVNPNFCGVAAGDVTGDGYPDLYFIDYDSSVTPGSFVEDPSYDLNDRLLVNDGSGYFTDESATRMTAAMLLSDFGTHAEIADINQDGTEDIVKDNALIHYAIRAMYNDPDSEGVFNIYENFETSQSPYDFNLGDLNADGRLDVVVSSDFLDRYLYNLGNDPLGRVIWGPAKVFTFLAGADDEFAGNDLIVDLDGDGWNDVVICDIDADVGGVNRRIHVYHNPGGTVGEQITLREERQSASPGGWLGAPGLFQPDLVAGHDVAAFDIDRDGDTDLVLGRHVGTFVWTNDLDPGVCQEDLGFGGPGETTLSVCGPALSAGSTATLLMQGAPPAAPAFLAFGFDLSPTPFAGGTLAPFPPAGVLAFVTDLAGVISRPVPGGGAGSELIVQFAVLDALQPEGFQVSNAVQLLLLP